MYQLLKILGYSLAVFSACFFLICAAALFDEEEEDRKSNAGLMVLFVGTLAGGVQMVRISHRRRNEKREKQVLQLAADKSGRITAEEVALVTNLSVEEGRKILDALCLQGAAQMYVTAEGVMEYVFPDLTSS